MTGHDTPPPEEPEPSARREAENEEGTGADSGAEPGADSRTGAGTGARADSRAGTGTGAGSGKGAPSGEPDAGADGDWDAVEFDMDFIRAADTSEPSARARMLAARWREEGGPPSPQPWRSDEPPAGWFFSRSRRARKRRKRRGDG
ncbi:hypothetical protein ACQYWQ_14885 [Streptomyces sp. P6-2-1]|uniref:SGM_3592 family protein n=1 Tax=Streptomyces sp. P6-2-1 TaxID=3422591 RepID=UPI003D36BA52